MFSSTKNLYKNQMSFGGVDLGSIEIETMEKDLQRIKREGKAHNFFSPAPEVKREKNELFSIPKEIEIPKTKPAEVPIPKSREIPTVKTKSEPPAKKIIQEKIEPEKPPTLTKKQQTSPFFSFPAPEKKIIEKPSAQEEIEESPKIKLRETPASGTEILPKKNERAEGTSVLNSLIESRMESNLGSIVIKEKERPKTAWRKLFFWSFFLFFLVASGTGIYYLWATDQLKNILSGKTTIGNLDIKNLNLGNLPFYGHEKEEEPKIETPQFSENNPNYLNLEMSSSVKSDIQRKLEKTAEKAASSGFSSPLEFIISDPQNNPVPLSVFIQKMDIAFSSELLEKISDNFSLYVYIEGKNPRIGLTIEISDKTLLRETLLKEEPSLPKELESLFLSANYKIENKPFQAGKYKEIATRYLNIASPDVLSVDYAITENQLILGTSQMTLRAIIDKLESQNNL